MANKINRIEIQFPEDVELTRLQEETIKMVVGDMCKSYEAQNPHRVMWPSGYGSKMLTSPFMVDEEHGMKFDEKCLAIEISEREDYEVTDKPSLKSIITLVEQEHFEDNVSEWVQQAVEKAYAVGLKDRELPHTYRRELLQQRTYTDVRTIHVHYSEGGNAFQVNAQAPEGGSIEVEVWVRRPKRKVD